VQSHPVRRRLPDERRAITHKFEVGGHEGYITVGLYPDGQPGEIFLKMAKEGSTVSGLMDSFATTVSVALQYGVPLRDLVNKFAHVRFEPSGFTGNQEIPIAKSIIDYIFRWLGSRFLGSDDKAALGLVDRSSSGSEYPSFGLSQASSAENNAPVADAQSRAFSSAEPATADRGSSATDETTEPRASVAVDAPSFEKGAGSAVAGSSATPAGTPSDGAGSGDQLQVIAKAGNGHAAPAKSNGSGTVTLSLGSTNVAFKIQEDAPSCAECGSIMVRNGSCYKCLNCGSTSGCS
jgi:ribonucleoside-diphosphate reductase alpha chain